jgi:alpha-beta hydrolase superfamily lysophospholipase
MPSKNMSKFEFPIGYHKFHKDQLFNFQLNRWYSSGYVRFEEMKEVGQKVKTFEDWKIEMLKMAEKAVSEERLMEAAFFYRAAEFYTFSDDPDKELLYGKFVDLFDKAFQNDGIERYKIPYKEAFLSVIKLPPLSDKKGTIVMHGGFDSYIEEFYSWMRFFSDQGYEVIAFEGPGQGAALKKFGLALDHEWEKPTKAILDYFKLEEVTLFGISMGGWFCLRAAAFEPRIKRVVASGNAVDYLQMAPLPVQWMVKFFLHFEGFSNWSANLKMKLMSRNSLQYWTICHTMYITKSKTSLAALKKILQLNEQNIHADRIKQDVLILSGEEDHFIPFKKLRKQLKALTNAKSVAVRVFTKGEQAQNHCQTGNIGLALEVMVRWLNEKSL